VGHRVNHDQRVGYLTVKEQVPELPHSEPGIATETRRAAARVFFDSRRSILDGVHKSNRHIDVLSLIPGNGSPVFGQGKSMKADLHDVT
jgi:hypothetical protein